MTKSIKAHVKPELLSWARESARLSQEEAARKIRVALERLQTWEAGTDEPTVAQLRKAGTAYKRPIAVFFLPEPPGDFLPMRDFRKLPDAAAGGYSPGLAVELRRALAQREAALELAEQLDRGTGPELTIMQLSGDPDGFAADARSVLGVDLNTQFSWRDKYEVLNGWIAALEDQSVLVFQTSDVAVAEARGFSITERSLPVIVVNGKDSPRGRVFTLMHEFAHILLNLGGLCDLHEDAPSNQSERIEVFCNHVAAAILVPRVWLEAERLVATHSGLEWAGDDLWELAKKYGVSTEVMLRRLVALGKASDDFYKQKREEFLQAYEADAGKPGRVPVSRRAVRDLGRTYVRLVLDAYHQEEITASDLASYLGVRLKHVPKIEQIVRTG